MGVARVSKQVSPDFRANYKRLPRWNAVAVQELAAGDPFPNLPGGTVLIDALFGSGLSRPLSGYWARLIQYLNQLSIKRVAVDIPSGVFADRPTAGPALHAQVTISFELPKLAFFFPENEALIGEWEVVPIGLHTPSLADLSTPYHLTDREAARSLLRPRPRFSHKGTFGHALLICGSYGMLGAALLSTRACLRSGAGLVTTHIPRCGYSILQMSVPEAMASVDRHEFQFSEVPELSRFSAIGIGCGLGQHPNTATALMTLLEQAKAPMVLDADALNILAQHPDGLDVLPEGSILTPHPGEFRRLTREYGHHFDRLNRLQELATAKKCIFMLKGAYTAVATPDGNLYFNATGNPGMATGGSGDVLTGLLTGLLAQGYPPSTAARLGAYLHGLAGDLAARELEHEALLASDIVSHIGRAFQYLKQIHA